MSRKSPILSIQQALVGIGLGTVEYINRMLNVSASYGEKVAEESQVPGVLYSAITGLFGGLYFFLKNLPRYIVLMLRNVVVFMIILSALIVAGKVDWLLNDIFGLLALSAILTYATYR